MLQFFKPKPTDFVAPMSGTLIPLHKVRDQVFSSKSMGDGFAIELNEGTVVSPVDGEIILVFPTKHAIGVLGEDKNEYLLHVGLDTVYLQGEGFQVHVEVGTKVKKGDPLLTIDLPLMKSKNIDLTSPILITNLEGRGIKLLKKGEVKQGDKDIIQID